jgi:hypothetical protein
VVSLCAYYGFGILVELIVGCVCRCWAHPDGGQAHGGTWHDALIQSSGTRAFEYSFKGVYPLKYEIYKRLNLSLVGTAVTVYGIVYDTKTDSMDTSQINVPGLGTYIDGSFRGNIVHYLGNSGAYQYNVAMSQITGLSDDTHTLRLEVMSHYTFMVREDSGFFRCNCLTLGISLIIWRL